MIYLKPENISTLDDDTFWMWFHRTFPSSYEVPSDLNPDDWIIQYAVMGPPVPGGKSAGLLWELYPEMKFRLGGDEWDAKIRRMKDCYERCSISITPSEYMRREFWPGAEVVPIGVDTDLFCPDDGSRSGVLWCGTDHPMKGRDLIPQFEEDWGEKVTVVMKGDLSQRELAKAMRRHKYFLFTGRLKPLFLVEWEALASGCIPINPFGFSRDPAVNGDPRQFVLDQGWSRHSVEEWWRRRLET